MNVSELLNDLIEEGYAVQKRSPKEIDVMASRHVHSAGRLMSIARRHGFCQVYVNAPPEDSLFDVKVQLAPIEDYYK